MNKTHFLTPGAEIARPLIGWLLAGFMAVCLAVCMGGCSQKAVDPQLRYADAKALFDHATKECHLPAAAAAGAERARLETQAIDEYQKLLKQYPDQPYWCAEALCGLGNVRAAQTNLDAALRCWSEVVAKYPQQEWEVLMALKSSGDLLWDAKRETDARGFYRQIIAQFDKTNQPQTVQIIVKGSKQKLGTKD
jgi:tetratricopeptide (TPR) repeat protein